MSDRQYASRQLNAPPHRQTGRQKDVRKDRLQTSNVEAIGMCARSAIICLE